jgi:hypothetical protein
MKSTTGTLFIGAVVVIALGSAYIYFFTGPASQPPLDASTANNAAEQQFLNLAAELQPISFDTSLFSDPRFANLVDLTVPITPEPQGRTDPFAPIPGLASGQ